MQTYNFKEHNKGDSFDGIIFTVSRNESPLNLTDVKIRMQFRLTPTNPNAIELSSEKEDEIEITNAAAGEFTVLEQIIDFPAGDYVYDIQFEFPDESIKTYISGKWKILQDITH